MSRARPWLAFSCCCFALALFCAWQVFDESGAPKEVPFWLGLGWLAKGYWVEVRELFHVKPATKES